MGHGDLPNDWELAGYRGKVTMVMAVLPPLGLVMALVNCLALRSILTGIPVLLTGVSLACMVGYFRS